MQSGFFLGFALSFLEWSLKQCFKWLCWEEVCVRISAVAFSFTKSQKAKSDSFESDICFSSIFLVLVTDVLPGLCQLGWMVKMAWPSILPAMRTGVCGRRTHLVCIWNEEWQLCALEMRRGERWCLKLLSFSHGPSCYVAMTLCLFHYPTLNPAALSR